MAAMVASGKLSLNESHHENAGFLLVFHARKTLSFGISSLSLFSSPFGTETPGYRLDSSFLSTIP